MWVLFPGFELLEHGDRRLEGLLDEGKSRLHMVMKLPRPLCAAIPRDISCYGLAFLQEYCGRTEKTDMRAALECARLHITETGILKYVCYASLERMLAYFIAQTERESYELFSFIRSWTDYLGWCRELEYDLNDRYYMFPKHFGREHDRVYREYRQYREEKKKKEHALACGRATRRMKKVRAQVGEISKGELQLVVPRSSGEIKEEGKRLHHCVGGYIEKVADRTTLIFF